MESSFNINKPIYINRALDIKKLLEKKSYFLLGPRQTGKSSLIRHDMPDVKVYNLLDSSTYLALSQNHGKISQELSADDKIIVIDEIQRLPELLNEVHLLIEEKGVHFLLTGSSARKLRRGGINLLGGRARTRYFHPLTYYELGGLFDLDKALNRGLLPSIYFSDDPQADLAAYAGSYLQEEIIAEGATRNAPAFSRFLKIAALCNGTIINFTNVANDAQIARTTVYEYFDILKDTLIIYELPAWKKTTKRKPLASSKYYFFDIAVAGYLQSRKQRTAGTSEYGEAFETWIVHELMTYRDYKADMELNYWRSSSGYEVDIIINDHTAVEIKAKENISLSDIKSLRALCEEKKLKQYICVSLEKTIRRVDSITIMPWEEFLKELWAGAFNG
jgi:predicted AAA+ superfamily ATPase